MIDLQHRACLPLWLYLIAQTATGGWVSVGSILQDVYGYDGVVINEQTGEVQDPKVRIKDRFHNQCATLRRLIEDACVEVGLPKTNIFHQKNEHKTSYWRLSDDVHIEDLSCVQECRMLLEGLEKTHADENAYRAQVRSACERTSCAIEGNLSDLLDADETHEPWIRRMVKDALSTYYKALTYLALDTQTEAGRTPDEETRRRFRRQGTQHWTRYALSCAQMAGELFEEQATLISNGEKALRKTLSGCMFLQDLERAITIYQEFKQLAEKDGDVWEPKEKTQRLWDKVLSENEAA